MKKFLILNNQDEIIGSYESEEKDETSNNRSYLLCPPHAKHIEVDVDITNIRLLTIDMDNVSIDLAKARSIKLEEIRSQRDMKLLENDKQWLIAAKKHEDTTSLEVEAQILRDMPEIVATELEMMITLEEINGYNPFEV